MRLNTPRADRRDRTQQRLAALAELLETADQRLDRSSGFLAATDFSAIPAELREQDPEFFGAGPRRKRG